MQYTPVIGLEIHIQLKTNRKMFCSCSADIWPSFAPDGASEGKKAKPNTHVCPVCLGLPGALPVINKKAVEFTLTTGLALNCKIAKKSFFERKNYFYPDLPKGYQISQYRKPLCFDGYLNLKTAKLPARQSPGGSRRLAGGPDCQTVRIERVHLEEDVAKSFHKGSYSLLDFNKSGIPLMEIVSAPDIHSVKEAVSYCKKIQQIVRYLGVSDADMERGQMRLEANVSVRPDRGYPCQGVTPQQLPPYRVEIKNINSFRFLEKALDYEIRRQTKALQSGKKLVQETRGFDERRGITFAQRTKEKARDYRYFPEPDLPPIQLGSEAVRQLGSRLPELPDQKMKRFVKKYKLSDREAAILTADRQTADYFEEVVKEGVGAEEAASWIINRPEELRETNPKGLAQKIKRQKEEVISDVKTLEPLIKKVIADNPRAVADFKKGKKEALKFLIGQIMRETRGKANPQLTSKLLHKILD